MPQSSPENLGVENVDGHGWDPSHLQAMLEVKDSNKPKIKNQAIPKKHLACYNSGSLISEVDNGDLTIGRPSSSRHVLYILLFTLYTWVVMRRRPTRYILGYCYYTITINQWEEEDGVEKGCSTSLPPVNACLALSRVIYSLLEPLPIGVMNKLSSNSNDLLCDIYCF